MSRLITSPLQTYTNPLYLWAGEVIGAQCCAADEGSNVTAPCSGGGGDTRGQEGPPCVLPRPGGVPSAQGHQKAGAAADNNLPWTWRASFLDICS